LPRNYSADFEIYGEKAQNPQDAKVDIFIGVHEKAIVTKSMS
jgi:predicted transcriptional regulator YdeE